MGCGWRLIISRAGTRKHTMATFYANPNEDREVWIERAAIDGYGFRIWHVIFFCFSGFTVLVVLICCCVRIRVPRTKQQIEADYRRKKLANKFRQRLKLIQNQDMDALDLQQALEIIQEDYKAEKRNIEYEIVPSCPPADYKINMENESLRYGKAEPQEPANFAKKIATMMKLSGKPTSYK